MRTGKLICGQTSFWLWRCTLLIKFPIDFSSRALSHDPHGPSQEWPRHYVHFFFFLFKNDLLVAFHIDRITWQPDIIIIALPWAFCCWLFNRQGQTIDKDSIQAILTLLLPWGYTSQTQTTAPLLYIVHLSLSHTRTPTNISQQSHSLWCYDIWSAPSLRCNQLFLVC